MKVSALVFIELKNTCRIQKENIETLKTVSILIVGFQVFHQVVQASFPFVSIFVFELRFICVCTCLCI